jgi:hypothetical protein
MGAMRIANRQPTRQVVGAGRVGVSRAGEASGDGPTGGQHQACTGNAGQADLAGPGVQPVGGPTVRATGCLPGRPAPGRWPTLPGTG